jgi:hypothetical protein
MNRTSKILKISGYVLLALAAFTLLYGVVVTFTNEDHIGTFATITVILTAIALFCISYSQVKEK